MSEQSQSGNGESVASDPSVESHASFEFESFDSPHPAASVASAAQRRANRRNARKSTGPRTAAGRAQARRNAITHGAFCRDALLPGEDPAALCELIVGAYGKFSPQDPIERGLVDRIVDAQWKITRLRRSERFAYGIGADRRADHDEADYLHKTWHQGRAPRHRAALQRVLNAALHDVPLQQPPPPPHPDDLANAADADRSRAAQDARERRHAQPPRGFADALDVAQAIADPAGVIERFSRITQRLEQSVSRAIRELRQLRADAREAGEEPLPCPYLEIDEEDEEEQEGEEQEQEQDEEDEEDDAEQEDANDEDVEDQDAEEDDGAAGVVTSLTMSDPTTDIAQNEPNSPQSIAGDDEDETYVDTPCNIDLVALMRRAAADAAERTGNRRRDRKLA